MRRKERGGKRDDSADSVTREVSSVKQSEIEISHLLVQPLVSVPTVLTRMGVSEGFWHHEYCLSPGAIWEDLKESADIQYPQPQHLLLCIPGAPLLIFV
ncbi:hypothetical protein EK904_009344 [Melospiza melodia maxima]|nr:hypothetical protein EK904_009344 [Melospiza melodia maxima]